MPNLRLIPGWVALLMLGLASVAPAWGQRTYIGAEACGVCHEEHPQWAQGSVHEKAPFTTSGGEKVTGCETCHGPGSEHTEDMTAATILAFRNEPAAARSAACLGCHGAMHPGLNFRRGDHDRRKVACDECHTASGSESFHAVRAAADSMADAEPGLCYQCHSAQRAGFAMPYRHPVAEGFMGCSGCHQAHGSYTLRQMRTRHNEEVCGRCHEDLEGPFIFEHPAGRASGCQTCHQPHGGANPKMLNRFQVQFLCLECHTNTPQFHDLAQPRYQNCTVCHSRIHGSHLNRHFLE